MKPKYFKLISCLVLLVQLCHFVSHAQLSKIEAGRYDASWWNRAPVRMIQTNLREIDAEMNVDAFIQSIVDASANVVLLNVGGIVANYPSKLPYHYNNPFMKGDMVGEIVKGLHARNIKVIGRFDFSKLNETLAASKPEWLYIGTNGKTVNYNGQVHTCINGGYQQEYTFDILKEAINSYPLDGIFFNMIGYTTKDYSGIEHGICQCENCKKRFRDSTGLVLPVKPDMSDSVFRQYNAFKKSTSDELFNRIGAFIKKLNPKLVICTYTDAGVDLIRLESGSFLTENEWNYSATDHVKQEIGSYDNKWPSNTSVHFLDYGFRHIATSPNIERVRVLENMLNGAPLDFYCIGTLVNQEDRDFIPILNDLYGFHKSHEKLFTNVQPVSDVCVVKGSNEEYEGIIKLLSEEHIMFDIMLPSAVGSIHAPHKLEDYKAIILGDVSNMSEQFISLVDNYVQNGGKVLSTGFTSINDQLGNPMKSIRLQSLGVMPGYELFQKSQSTYLKLSQNDLSMLGNKFKNISLIMMYSDFLKCKVKGNAEQYLKLVPKTRFGPPEKSYYAPAEITDVPGMISNTYSKGKTVFIPWLIGSQYNFKGQHAHRALFMSALQELLKVRNSIVTNASPLIEITHMASRIGAFEWIGMINHSGQIGASFREPVAIHNTSIRFKPLKPVKEIRLMRSGKAVVFQQKDGWVSCVVSEINDFEMLLCVF